MSPKTPFARELACAMEAATQAGTIMLQALDQDLRISDKGASNNLVTHVDTACEAAIINILRNSFPDHDFLGEEGQYPDTGSPWVWIIDPIDGTTNFIKGIRYFSVSIALTQRTPGTAHQTGQSVVAVVLNPVTREMFWAVRGQGAWLRVGSGVDKRLGVSPSEDLEHSILVTGFYYDRGKAMQQTLRHIEAFMLAGIMDIRRFGSAALDLCHVAAGRVEGFWEHTLFPWDFAGGILIVREAGGLVSDMDGGPLPLAQSSIIAASPAIHAAMLPVLDRSSTSP